MRPLHAWEIAAFEQLGVSLHLKGDVLTITFRNGASETWLALDGPAEQYHGLEVLTLSERVFARVPIDEGRPMVADYRTYLRGIQDPRD